MLPRQPVSFVFFLVYTSLSAVAANGQVEFPLDARSTHLRTRNDPAPNFTPRVDFIYVDADRVARHADPLSIQLATAIDGAPLFPGDRVLLESVGEYCFHNPTCHLRGQGIWGIFSRDGNLLEDNSREIVNRVPGSVAVTEAIGADDVITIPDETLPTDIPNDFLIHDSRASTRTVIRIPPDATHLFASAPDVQWFDNFVPANGRYALRITKYSRSSDTGEFDGDAQLTLTDVNQLQVAIIAGSHDIHFDLTFDGLVNIDDLQAWVTEKANTYPGDANLDGQFNSSDLIAIFSAGEYEDELVRNSTWSTGDWTADGEFNSSDLVAALSAGGFEQGPRGARTASAVPEPRGRLSLCIAASVAAGFCVRTRTRHFPCSPTTTCDG